MRQVERFASGASKVVHLLFVVFQGDLFICAPRTIAGSEMEDSGFRHLGLSHLSSCHVAAAVFREDFFSATP